jgi:hypothetical protein
MPAFADAKATASSSGEERLEELFKADLQYRSDSQSDAVVVAEGREGIYIGSGDGTVSGDRLRGTLRWSMWSGNCLYPLARSGQSVPEGLHLCTMVKFQQTYQMRHRKSRDEDARWGFNSAISSF